MKPLRSNTLEPNNTRDYDPCYKSWQATSAITHADMSRSIHDFVMPALSLPRGRSPSQLKRDGHKKIARGTNFGTHLWPLSALCPFVHEAATCSSPPHFMIAPNTPLWKTNCCDRKQDLASCSESAASPSTPPVDYRMSFKTSMCHKRASLRPRYKWAWLGIGGAGRAREARHEGSAETHGREGRGAMARTSALGWEQLGMPACPAC